MATASAAATMVPALIVLSLISSFVALEPQVYRVRIAWIAEVRYLADEKTPDMAGAWLCVRYGERSVIDDRPRPH
jgi:hypothetical protein